jgi:hypothetical protein
MITVAKKTKTINYNIHGIYLFVFEWDVLIRSWYKIELNVMLLSLTCVVYLFL